MSPAMTERLSTVRDTLAAYDQSHLLTFFDELDAAQQDALLGQIEGVDFARLQPLIEKYVHGDSTIDPPTSLAPAPYYPYDPGDAYDGDAMRAAGEELIRGGRVAAFTVAGGQGTRLGWNGPKGTYPATPVSGKPLFRVFTEQLLAVKEKYGVTIPWYIMTSQQNDADTRAFFLDNNCFGMNRRDIFMFPQGMLPVVDKTTGKVLLESKHQLALAPDGHGGAMRALEVSGAIADMEARGVEHIAYFQVDNPLVQIIDPRFIGLHAAAPDSSGEMSSKMVPKARPDEKVGVLCHVDGKIAVIEYSDLPEALANERTADGAIAYNAGNCAIHMVGTKFVSQVTNADSLPFHKAVKKARHVDLATGETVEPAEPNAVKLEMFIFDALPIAGASIVYETSRAEEFAPIKNATGVDSAESSHQLQSDRAARWLETAGVTVARDADGHAAARIEISPLTALEPSDLQGKDLPASIGAGEDVAL